MRPRVGRRRGRRHPLWLLRVGASRQGCGPFAEVSRENIAEQQRKTYVISDNLLPMALVFWGVPTTESGGGRPVQSRGCGDPSRCWHGQGGFERRRRRRRRHRMNLLLMLFSLPSRPKS